MSRFAAAPKPEGNIATSVALYADWQDLKSKRTEFDRLIIAWADRIEQGYAFRPYNPRHPLSRILRTSNSILIESFSGLMRLCGR